VTEYPPNGGELEAPFLADLADLDDLDDLDDTPPFDRDI
jgi:hypothetical protein